VDHQIEPAPEWIPLMPDLPRKSGWAPPKPEPVKTVRKVRKVRRKKRAATPAGKPAAAGKRKVQGLQRRDSKGRFASGFVAVGKGIIGAAKGTVRAVRAIDKGITRISKDMFHDEPKRRKSK
jgi:hypothetical protein